MSGRYYNNWQIISFDNGLKVVVWENQSKQTLTTQRYKMENLLPFRYVSKREFNNNSSHKHDDSRHWPIVCDSTIYTGKITPNQCTPFPSHLRYTMRDKLHKMIALNGVHNPIITSSSLDSLLWYTIYKKKVIIATRHESRMCAN